MNLLVVEMRRALHRRVVRVLLLLALIGCALTGLLAFTSSTGRTLAELHASGATHPAVLTDWWVAGGGESALLISSLFLLMGGFVGGASVAGAEWRAGTITTTLTWEPRRLQLHAARLAACGVLAMVLSLALQAVFLGSLVPAVLANGSPAGTDASWWVALGFAMARVSLITAIAAVLGASLATLGRNTAFALVAVVVWGAVAENLIRGLRPGLAAFLWGENVATAVSWTRIDGAAGTHGPVPALATVLLYATAIAVVGTVAFRRRDVAGLS